MIPTVQKYKKVILNTIFQHLTPEDCIVFLFGSQATGEALETSDIDIGILCRDKISAKAFVEAEEVLNTDLPTLRKIDLVDFSSVDKKVRQEALKEIKIWHVGKNCRALSKNLKLV
ncbi:MAG: nucleotidyltransferase domain-containing protein [Deltaproteobacteria bacterium]|nr:nucleotidyltransferase domain-containing protein [Deltaproteobacteria bacterium]